VTFSVRLKKYIALLCFVLLTACNSGNDSGPNHSDYINIAHNSDTASDIEVSLPQRLRTTLAVDPANIRGIVNVDGTETEMIRNASTGEFTAQVEVPARSNINVSIRFYEIYSGQELTLASFQRNYNVGGVDTPLILRASDYLYQPHDQDSDGVSNFDEREFGSDPLDGSQTPQITQVRVFVEKPQLLAGNSNSEYVMELSIGSFNYTGAAGEFTLNGRDFSVVNQDPLAAQVRYLETRTGQRLTIATQEISLSSNQRTVQFGTANYRYGFDQDQDGVSNLDELLSGQDLLSAGDYTFAVRFSMPAEIADPGAATGELIVNGNAIPTTRNGNTFDASVTLPAGSSAEIVANIIGTYQGQGLLLANFSTQDSRNLPAYELNGWSFEHDDDGDDTLNYLELANGTNPFVIEVLGCTPQTETLSFGLTDDAFLNYNSGLLVNTAVLRVAGDLRESLIRFQYSGDPASLDGEITSAQLVLTVAGDQGSGEIEVYSLKNFEWNDLVAEIDVPDAGQPVVSQSQDFWASGERYLFDIPASAIAIDTTFIVVQVPSADDDADVAFTSSLNGPSPEFTATVERCL